MEAVGQDGTLEGGGGSMSDSTPGRGPSLESVGNGVVDEARAEEGEPDVIGGWDEVEPTRTDEDDAAIAEVEATVTSDTSRLVGTPEQLAAIDSSWESAIMSEIIADLPFGSNDSDPNSTAVKEGGKKDMWRHYHSTFTLFINFLGRAVAEPALVRAQVPLSPLIVDTKAFDLLHKMSKATPLYIRSFLECRRRGLKVSGGLAPLKMVTVNNNMKPLGYLFASCVLPKRLGGGPVSPDCGHREDPFRIKPLSDQAAERLRGVAAGTYMGNPMNDARVSGFRRDETKNAMEAGERPQSNAPVTDVMMEAFYDRMVVRHVRARTARSSFNATQDSESKAVFHAFTLYAFSFMTISRPVTTLRLVHRDIQTPNPRLPVNAAFMRRYVLFRSFFVCLSERVVGQT